MRTVADIGKERIRRVLKQLEQIEAGKLPMQNAQLKHRGFQSVQAAKFLLHALERGRLEE